MRARLWAMALVALLSATSAADAPLEEFPARFDVGERLVIVSSLRGHGIARRWVRRGAGADVLVFDDGTNLHLEATDEWPAAEATWRWTSHRRLRFEFTPETLGFMEQEMQDTLGFAIELVAGPGRVAFRRDHRTFTGRQVIRARGTYGGFRVAVIERVRYFGTPQEAPPQASAGGGLGAPLRAALAGSAATGE